MLGSSNRPYDSSPRCDMRWRFLPFAGLMLGMIFCTDLGAQTASAPLVLAAGGKTAPLLVAPTEVAGVKRAAADLAADFGRVTGTDAVVVAQPPAQAAVVIVAGTLGQSPWIDAWASEGRLVTSELKGRWEAFRLQIVDRPFPGVERALVIAGSDRRGTIFGLYELSQHIGVSPWYWWADVPPTKSSTLTVPASLLVQKNPAVKYRGIFLNDEYPALTRWVASKYGMADVRTQPPVPEGVTNYGREFYTKIFELLLRLQANTLWPAMWNNAFNEDDPENARLAHEYGIVMGTSHQEPMMRAQKEWDRRFYKEYGSWNYAKQPDLLESFWKAGIARNKDYDNLVTIGLRGANDTEMAPGGPEADKKLLETIVARQRDLIAQATGKTADQVPQVWALYKEVQDYYNAGMRVPDDVTLLWAEDNWGNLRRVPTAEERKRAGGAGIYYHFDYHGAPRSYQWINTTPISKIWDQMSLAHQYGADRLWIVNVGHLKGYEYPLSFFLKLAWDPDAFQGETLDQYTENWVAGLFGASLAPEAASILTELARYHGRIKPELLSPSTFSAVNYREAERVLEQWRSLETRAQAWFARLSPEAQDAGYQLVLFPVRASAILYDIYVSAGRNQLWAEQGRPAANGQADRVKALFKEFQALMDHYNGPFAQGKWSRFMDQAVLGYQGWADPPKNNIDHLYLRTVAPKPGSSLAVAVEGSDKAWTTLGATLEGLDSLQPKTSTIEILNQGNTPFEWKAETKDPWITVVPSAGKVVDQEVVTVQVDWNLAPEGRKLSAITFTGAGSTIRILVPTFRWSGGSLPPADFQGHVETNKWVSIEAPHFGTKIDTKQGRWTLIQSFGATLGGMRAWAVTDAPKFSRSDAPRLEYPIWFNNTGEAQVTVTLSPINNVFAGRDIRIGVSLDSSDVQILTIVPGNYNVTNENKDWSKAVSNGRRTLTTKVWVGQKGSKVLKLWMLDPGPVVEKITLDLGNLKPSFLGPPESPRIIQR